MLRNKGQRLAVRVNSIAGVRTHQALRSWLGLL